MKCEEVMTKKVVCCFPDDDVNKAARIMKQSDIGAIPVVDDDENRLLMGIITDRDLAIRVVGGSGDAKSMKVNDVMTKKLVTCHAFDEVQRVLDLMADNQLRRIPVVDNDSRVIGIIAQADIATRLNQPEKTAEVVKDISESNI
jgi:CBS domain-containing protein